MNQDTPRITFIGAGNMANSIIGGLVNTGFDANTIVASDPNSENLDALTQQYGIRGESDNSSAIQNCNVIVLAVKPQVMANVCQNLAGNLSHDALVISIAAGITCSSIATWLSNGNASHDIKIVRCMPNTPALVLEGASALYAAPEVSEAEKALAEKILSAVGSVNWVDSEALMDPVTAVSGSGPAYFFLLLEAMIDAGVDQGLDRSTAETLAVQTALGAAKLAKESDVDVAELRRRVTSPKGTTEQALLSFEKSRLRDIVAEAMKACADRSRELAVELGSDQS